MASHDEDRDPAAAQIAGDVRTIKTAVLAAAALAVIAGLTVMAFIGLAIRSDRQGPDPCEYRTPANRYACAEGAS